MPLPLVPHPKHPPAWISTVTAQVVGIEASWLRLRWRVSGTRRLVLPPAAGGGRTDGLWRITCFEAFFRPESQATGANAYVELNLSPSGRWNAYDFTAHREGMAPRPVACAPTIVMRVEHGDAERTLVFDAAVPLDALPPLPCRVGLTAVLEEDGGIKSYWALAHPSRDAPDFHSAAGFTARLSSTSTPSAPSTP